MSVSHRLLPLIRRKKEVGSPLMVARPYDAALMISSPNDLRGDTYVLRQFFSCQHALRSQSCRATGDAVPLTQLKDMDTSPRGVQPRYVPLLVELLGGPLHPYTH